MNRIARPFYAETLALLQERAAEPAVLDACLRGAGFRMQLKFVPSGAKLEMRVRGVSVFPGYRDAPDLTAQAFDEEGFYKIGDAGRLLDDQQPGRGVVFDGRVAEDFKLGSGTWVSVGTLRVKLVSALAPLAQDAVITGHDRDEAGALIFPTAQAGQLAPQALRERVREVLRDMTLLTAAILQPSCGLWSVKLS